MVNFNDVVVDDIIDYKTEDELCRDYLQYIDLDSTIKNTFPFVVGDLVRKYNTKIITDLYLNNTDTYNMVPIYDRDTVHRKYQISIYGKSIEKYDNDYEHHAILINHNLVNCLIAIFSKVDGCNVKRVPPVYSKEDLIVFDKMEGIKLTVPRKNYYPKNVVELYDQDSKAAIVKREMLDKKLASLDLGIADITPYLKIEYPKEYVLDDLSINQDILLKVGDYRLTQKAQQLVDHCPSLHKDLIESDYASI